MTQDGKHLNNLGAFTSLAKVWETHPEGGREGDYLTIAGVEHFWDKYLRQWVPSSGGGDGDQTTDPTVTNHVDGDLDVSGDLHVGGDATVVGTLTVGDLRVSGGERFKGQSSFKSIVFKRSSNKPDKPSSSSATYSNPVPDGWNDGIPSGTDPVWMTSRIFTSDGKAPQEGEWHEVQLMVDTAGFDVEFSPWPTTSVPAPPNMYNQIGNNKIWFDPVLDRSNPNADWSAMNWMATRHKDVGSVDWSNWTIVLIKGEQGDGWQSVYKVSKTKPERYNGTYPPALNSDWKASVDDLTVSGDFLLWMCERRFFNGEWSEWSEAVRISGPEGKAGADGETVEFIYKPSNRLPDTGGSDVPADNSLTENDYIPEGWYDNPHGVGDVTIDGQTQFFKYEWMCQREKSGGLWGAWSRVFVWSAYGDKGFDGDGVEYVFIRTSTKWNPGVDETHEDSNGNIQGDDEFLPQANQQSYGYADAEDNSDCKEYTDNPKGVEENWPFEWVCKRKQIHGVWEPFGEPALWATYSKEHTIDINAQGYWVIDGELGPKAEGEDGSGIEIKDTVDYYSSNDATTNKAGVTGHTPTSLEGITNDTSVTKNLGDCYVVDYVDVSSNDADNWTRGHIFVYRGGSSNNWEDKWHDLGAFRGRGTWMHLAWCENIVYQRDGNNNVVIDSNTNRPSVDTQSSGPLVLVKGAASYPWMGIRVDSQPEDPNTHNSYEWTYLKGQDGFDIEYVYIRTKIETPPTITDAATQDADVEPYVDNIDSYQYDNNYKEIERNKFYDDPSGVSADWPYEWMSKREKIGGAWRAFQSPAVLWARYSKDGTSTPSIKPEPAMFAVDVPSTRVLPASRQLTLKCRLFDGSTLVQQTSTSGWTLSANAQNGRLAIGSPSLADGAVVWVITLNAGVTLSSCELTVTKTYGGNQLKEIVPISIISEGSPGKGVSAIDTYYLLTTQFQGVTRTTDGWVKNQYQDPTELAPYLWRYIRYTLADGTYEFTPCELIAVWSSNANPNLLADTDFIADKMSAWRKTGDVVAPSAAADGSYFRTSDTGKDGHRSYVGRFKDTNHQQSGNGYVVLLSQDIYRPSAGIRRLEPGQWYTLSFWVKDTEGSDGQLAVHVKGGYTYEGANQPVDLVDKQQPTYVDGVATSTSTEYIDIATTNNWVKHTYTFKTTTGIEPDADTEGTIGYYINFLLYSTAAWQHMYVCMPKLEAGLVATPYVAMREVTNPMARTSTWQAGKQYYQGMQGEPYLDIVRNNGSWYRCIRTHVSTNSITPADGSYWLAADEFRFLATDLLLADEGVIDLLYSQKILMMGPAYVLTASINNDGCGSYVIYYPNGRKRMELSYEGYIAYYNDDEGNSLAWRLGEGGTIEKIQYASYQWTEIKLAPITGANLEQWYGGGPTPPLTRAQQVTNIDSGTTFSLSNYKYWKCGSADGYNNVIYDVGMGTNPPSNPATATRIADGWYTPTARAFELMDGDTHMGNYAITVYKIVNGRIVKHLNVTSY